MLFKSYGIGQNHTSLKSSDELVTAKDKRLRTICQIGNIAFSLLSLGVFIPIYTRSKTNKKHAEELAKLNADKSSATSSASSSSGTNGAGKGSSSDEFTISLVKDNTAFKSFFNS